MCSPMTLVRSFRIRALVALAVSLVNCGQITAADDGFDWNLLSEHHLPRSRAVDVLAKFWEAKVIQAIVDGLDSRRDSMTLQFELDVFAGVFDFGDANGDFVMELNVSYLDGGGYEVILGYDLSGGVAVGVPAIVDAGVGAGHDFRTVFQFPSVEQAVDGIQALVLNEALGPISMELLAQAEDLAAEAEDLVDALSRALENTRGVVREISARVSSTERRFHRSSRWGRRILHGALWALRSARAAAINALNGVELLLSAAQTRAAEAAAGVSGTRALLSELSAAQMLLEKTAVGIQFRVKTFGELELLEVFGVRLEYLQLLPWPHFEVKASPEVDLRAILGGDGTVEISAEAAYDLSGAAYFPPGDLPSSFEAQGTIKIGYRADLTVDLTTGELSEHLSLALEFNGETLDAYGDFIAEKFGDGRRMRIELLGGWSLSLPDLELPQNLDEAFAALLNQLLELVPDEGGLRVSSQDRWVTEIAASMAVDVIVAGIGVGLSGTWVDQGADVVQIWTPAGGWRVEGLPDDGFVDKRARAVVVQEAKHAVFDWLRATR